jgi:predicted DNA-binding protein with PD1-like motif
MAKTKELMHQNGKTFVVVCDKGDDPVAVLESFAHEKSVSAASFTAIGAFSDVTLGYFDPDVMQYREVPVDEQVEVLSMIGDIASNQGEPAVHAHVVVGRCDATTRGGHLLGAHVWPTLEIMLTLTPTPLRKLSDPATGLALIDPDLG